ncbi:hypothetical protein QFZ94_008958 [Paraburkholderia sp. JPY465]
MPRNATSFPETAGPAHPVSENAGEVLFSFAIAQS